MRYILLNEEFNKIHSTSRCISIAAMLITLSFLISSTKIFAQHHELYLSNGEHVRLEVRKAVFIQCLQRTARSNQCT